ncbi:hypothetical protein [Kitasatospora mediocidica]|uniref:hypothetical protein n=1 Tax=Kitasatospora mediocidica TaxID=58352 RepID=UPI0005609E84|nr:hypothetical protein [Kitasatospora mediocidica]
MNSRLVRALAVAGAAAVLLSAAPGLARPADGASDHRAAAVVSAAAAGGPGDDVQDWNSTGSSVLPKS